MESRTASPEQWPKRFDPTSVLAFEICTVLPMVIRSIRYVRQRPAGLAAAPMLADDEDRAQTLYAAWSEAKPFLHRKMNQGGTWAKMIKSQDIADAELAGSSRLSRVARLSAIGGLLAFAITIVAFLCIPQSTPHLNRISSDGFYKQAVLRLDVILLGTFVSAYLLTPLARAVVAAIRPLWRDTYTYLALLGICIFLCVFIIHFGRQQFGAFDFNILIEMGWRQILGQRPYLDF